MRSIRTPIIFLFFVEKYASSKLLLIISEQILRNSTLSIVTTSSKLLCTLSPYHAEGQNAYFETSIYIIQTHKNERAREH